MDKAYVAGKYTVGDTDLNIFVAREIAMKLWERGFVVICPHTNSARFERDCMCDYNQYLKGYLELLQLCDIVVMVPNWEESHGAKLEHKKAKELGIPIFYAPHLPQIKEPVNE